MQMHASCCHCHDNPEIAMFQLEQRMKRPTPIAMLDAMPESLVSRLVLLLSMSPDVAPVRPHTHCEKAFQPSRDGGDQ